METFLETKCDFVSEIFCSKSDFKEVEEAQGFVASLFLKTQEQKLTNRYPHYSTLLLGNICSKGRTNCPNPINIWIKMIKIEKKLCFIYLSYIHLFN